MRVPKNWIFPAIATAAVLDVGLILAAGGSLQSDDQSLLAAMDDQPAAAVEPPSDQSTRHYGHVLLAQAINTPTPPQNDGPGGKPAVPGQPDLNAPGIAPTPPGMPHPTIPPQEGGVPTVPKEAASQPSTMPISDVRHTPDNANSPSEAASPNTPDSAIAPGPPASTRPTISPPGTSGP